jgi:hypothetical protein
MLETTMNKETFEKVTQPTLLLYYYKNEKEQDPIVKVSAMLDMFETIATPEDLKVKKAIPTAGDHVLASPIKSAAVSEVEQVCSQFFADKLRLKSKNTE